MYTETNRKTNAFASLWDKVHECRMCPLCQTRTNAVFGEMNPDADIMFIGEAPGKTEDETGRPFVGPAGQLLERYLQKMHLRREDVFIANILKCRPPANRDPQDDEIKACTLWLNAQIGIIEPKVIVTLGNFATKYITGTQQGISSLHGTVITLPDGKTVMPMYHPSAALHNPNLLGAIENDFRKMALYLNIPMDP